MQLHWNYEPFISFDEFLLYHNAVSHRSDSINYHPVAVAKRHEIGIRYRYLCTVNPKDFPGGPSRFVIIEIYKPEQSMPYVTKFISLPSDLPV